ncbi:MAG: hypothetical protein ACI8UP_002449, partial [Porticoccaceae bacterium]
MASAVRLHCVRTRSVYYRTASLPGLFMNNPGK